MKLKNSILAVAIGGVFAGAMPRAEAHIVMTEPKPRDNRDDHKNDAAPCIPRTAAQTVSTFTAGQTISVKFGETVNHPGCFVVDFAASDTAEWQMLATIPHSNMGSASPARPRPYTKDVKLPDAPCTKCVLRLRQIMLRADPPMCPPAMIPRGETYYSCANIEITGAAAPDGGSTPPDAGADMGAPGTGGAMGTGGSPGTGGTVAGTGGSTAGTGGSTPATGGSSGTGTGGTSSTGTGGGSGSARGGSSGTGAPPAEEPKTGCSVGAGSPSALGLGLAAFAALLLRRRRRG